eukprot:TRINITY_DN20817_c0_g1_i1.p2 TRINITY_DN20817_c0_g1~~TRINITY_DN20817_c0_g1_i1.p2  ORF type:complete len:114 (-),score=28.06 TRINITY_DN20817_c0_g1_i1:386-727(-)
MDDLAGDDTSFIADDVREMIREVAESVIKKETPFKASMVEEHTSAVIEEVLKRLTDQRKPFKYVVTVSITQRAGMGVHMATSTHWDPNHDDYAICRWEGDHMYAIVAVYGAQI